MRDISWFFRGAQSAVFLYASCGPCIDASSRRKRRRAAVKSRKEKARLRAEDPNGPHQPAAFDTNPYWQEEIALGPGPPPRRKAKSRRKEKEGLAATGDRALTTGTRSSLDSSSAGQDAHRFDLSTRLKHIDLKNLDPAVIKENWHNRFQRRDEEFISDDDGDYSDSDLHTDGPSSALNLRRQIHLHAVRKQSHSRSSNGGAGGWPSRRIQARSKQRHYTTRAPPINDLHPPIVVTPSPYRADRDWMKEPPPSAAFMSGKEGSLTRVPSRNDSSVSHADFFGRVRSRSSPRMGPSLTRHVAQKTVDEKIRRGETPETLPLSRGSSRITRTHSPRPGTGSPSGPSQEPVSGTQIADYADSTTPGSSFDIQRRNESISRSRKKRPPRLSLGGSAADDSSDSDDSLITPVTTLSSSAGCILKPEAAYDPQRPVSSHRSRRGHARLTTIMSNEAPSHGRSRSPASSPPRRPNAGSENVSPVNSTRSSPSASPHLAAHAFQPFGFDASVSGNADLSRRNTAPPATNDADTSSPNAVSRGNTGSPKRHDSKLAPLGDPPLAAMALQHDLVAPVALLKSRYTASPEPDERFGFPPPEDADDEADDDDELDDGWLWNSKGERKFSDRDEARDVRNRWSMDF